MKLNIGLGGTGVLALAALAVLGFAAWYIYSKRAAILSSVNPADANNLANQAVTKLVTETTGREETLGGLIADWFNPAAREVNQLYSK